MNRKETTKFLTDLLIGDRLSDRKYYAKEVTLDYGTIQPKRIDVMEFRPKGVVYASDMEKGIFVCYEIKSCYEDVYSGHGLNFYGEKNYIVTTMDTYKKLQEDIRSEKLQKHIADFMGVKVCPQFGIIVPVPARIDQRSSNEIYSEYENPTKLDGDMVKWRMYTAVNCHEMHRTRPTVEMLFCMLRSKHSDTNRE